jgi:hypothetical protein
MRLGGFYAAERAEDLGALCERLDRHGLSAIPAPGRLAECRTRSVRPSASAPATSAS